MSDYEKYRETNIRSSKNYYYKHKEEIKEKYREYAKNHREEKREYDKKRIRSIKKLKNIIKRTINYVNERTYLGDGQYTDYCDMLSRSELLEILGDKENE